MDYMVLDIWMEILSRVGVRDLIRLKSVSKTFLDLISNLLSNDDFIRLHLNKSSLRAICYRLGTYLCLKQEEFGSSLRAIEIKRRAYSDYRKQYGGEEVDEMETLCYVRSYGSCNGLVCLLANDEKNKYASGALLWNQALREAEFVPIKRPNKLVYCFWFGYDDDEYKLVLGTDSHFHLIRLYIDTDCWKSSRKIKLERRSYDIGDSLGTLVHRTLHWPAGYGKKDRPSYDGRKLKILSYDLRNERVRWISTPHGDTPDFPMLGQVDGCLSTMFEKHRSMELWVMKEYGVRESWTRLMVLPFNVVSKLRYRVQPHHVVELQDPAQIDSPIYRKDYYIESLISPRSIKTKMMR